MRWILSLGMLAAVCAWAGSAAAYQPAPLQIAYYDYQIIPAYRGQACTMPPSFTPGPICCESACCCCLHVWDDYCQPKPCCRLLHWGHRASACDGGQPAGDGGQRPCAACGGQ